MLVRRARRVLALAARGPRERRQLLAAHGRRRRRRPDGRLARASASVSRSRSRATSTSATATSRSARASRSWIRPSSSAASRTRAATRRASSQGEPGTFGVERRGDSVRIVWYFNAQDQTRAFTVSYTLRGLAVAYDDVVDVNLKVWGDQWDGAARPARRRSRRHPGRSCARWGKPVWVRGDVELDGHAGDAPRRLRPGTPVRRAADARSRAPRSRRRPACASSAGTASTAIVAEELADAEGYEQDHERDRRAQGASRANAVSSRSASRRSPPSS